ncbi:TatD family hydrolase [bacterium]|jgi:TatD DNase family protein|nr:TatD family hydrolase [bacterium]
MMSDQNMGFVDSHAHLDFPDFQDDLDDIVERSKAAGIRRIVTIGTDLESSANSIALAERFDNVYAVVGWHPCTALEAPEDIRSELREMAAHPKVVAIGETGLDYHHLPSEEEGKSADDDALYKTAQTRIFEQQMEVAAEAGLNIVVHQRDAYDDAIKQWAPFATKGVRGVFHCFVGTVAEMQHVIGMAGLVSFTGIVTFKNAASVRETLAATPIDCLMLETDCPYLAPVPYRGKRCEPAYVKEIAAQVAAVKGVRLDVLASATNATAEGFYRGMAER